MNGIFFFFSLSLHILNIFFYLRTYMYVDDAKILWKLHTSMYADDRVRMKMKVILVDIFF